MRIVECAHKFTGEIEAEYLVLRDYSSHQNIISFYGLYIRRDTRNDPQLWTVMEVSGVLGLSRFSNSKSLDHATKYETLQIGNANSLTPSQVP